LKNLISHIRTIFDIITFKNAKEDEMRKLCIFLLSLLFVYSINLNTTVKAQGVPPKVSADGAVLMDAATGKILYGKNMDKPYPPASTTKIMTALLTLERCNLDDVVVVGKNPPLADGSKIYINEGEQFKVKDLLYALLLASANDCAEALAEHISGSNEQFAKLMNERAKELGCTDTNFVNPNGLYNDKHRTSAKDLALIMRELVKHPEYTKIATTPSYKIPPTNKSKEARPLWNGNKLVQKSSIYYFSGCEGGKTGYTVQSDHSYVASATRNGQRLIVALMHDKNKTFFPDSINLFNYGYNNFQLVKMYSKGDVVTNYSEKGLNIKLLAGEDFYYVKDKNDAAKATLKIENKDLSSLSFKNGDNVLNASVTLKGAPIENLKLLSDSDHIVNISTAYQSMTNNVGKVITAMVSVVIPIIIITFIIRRIKLRANN
jgi:D-alanyl-D-alanine carboxypeptidase